jgi:predicted metalloendopeptidase
VPRDKKTDAVFNKIYENQLHLSNLLNVVNQFKGKAEFDALIPDMENLLTLYKSFKETSALQQDGAKKLYDSVAALRSKLIS